MAADAGISEAILVTKMLAELVGKLANSSDTTANIKQLNSELIPIQTAALSGLNEANFLARRNRELEEENAALKDWKAEAAQHSPRQISQGIFVHMRNDAVGPLDGAQKFCSNCFYQKQKSLLQFQLVEVGRKRSLVCHRCKATIIFHGYLEPSSAI